MNRMQSRRSFLKNSLRWAGAAGAAVGAVRAEKTVAAPRGFAPDPTGPASKKITIGCIGVGGMGTGNMRNFLGLPDCRVVAVCDAYAQRREAAKDIVDAAYEDKGCAMYADYRELLARPEIDAVMIAVQDHSHALVATAAAKAAKDMYCEKPLGVSVAEGRAIRDAVRKHGRVFQTGTWQRSERKFQHACELARNGYLGKIHTIEVATEGPQYRPKYAGPMDPQPVPPGFDWAMWRGPAPAKPYNPGRVAWPDWYLIFDYCAGFITNWGVHHLDIANWGCPRVGSETCDIECTATYRREGLTDNVDAWKATLVYPGGLKMVFSDSLQQKPGCKFIGQTGWVHVDRSGIWAHPESLLKAKLKQTDQPLTDAKHHGDNFLQCVRSRKDPVSDVDAAHQASTLGLVCDIAARLKRKLTWDPKAERFVGADEADRLLVRPMHNGWTLG